MENKTAINIFESLASGVRLDVFRLLVEHGQQGLVAGEIAQALGVPPTNLSFRANIPMMLDLVAFLTEKCCSGHIDQCKHVVDGTTSSTCS